MRKKYVIAAVAALGVVLSGAVGFVLVRRARSEMPPVSATVPRVEELRTVTPSEAASATS